MPLEMDTLYREEPNIATIEHHLTGQLNTGPRLGKPPSHCSEGGLFAFGSKPLQPLRLSAGDGGSEGAAGPAR